MKRRDLLKKMPLAGFGMAVFPMEESVKPLPFQLDDDKDKKLKVPGGRTKEEAIRDEKLKKEVFFTPHELATLAILSDIIIPADGISGSATQAEVPAFIEFMMKDQPVWQTPFRGGLKWLDNQSLKRFGKTFKDAAPSQRIEIVEDIAYPEQAKKEMSQGVSFFNMARNFVSTGFFTSQMGIKDIGYVGNVPNKWEGVPADVLKQYGFE